MTASDYPINFPYGATDAPYSAAHPHRGDDHPCPTGTPLVIGGGQIGLTGATGNVIGPHLHIQEWHNEYSDVRKPQNAFAPGTVVNVDPTGTQGDGSFGKFITIQTADGWNDTYCHLSWIDVNVGDVLTKGVMMTPKNLLINYFQALLGREPDQGAYDSFLGKPADLVFDAIITSPEYHARQQMLLEAPTQIEQIKDIVT
jgi:hypothetical protein